MKVNRRFHHEVLPVWNWEKSFDINKFPKTHSEMTEVWEGFVDLFKSHAADADGSHCLSCIRYLDIEHCHPAFGS